MKRSISQIRKLLSKRPELYLVLICLVLIALKQVFDYGWTLALSPFWVPAIFYLGAIIVLWIMLIR